MREYEPETRARADKEDMDDKWKSNIVTTAIVGASAGTVLAEGLTFLGCMDNVYTNFAKLDFDQVTQLFKENAWYAGVCGLIIGAVAGGVYTYLQGPPSYDQK